MKAFVVVLLIVAASETLAFSASGVGGTETDADRPVQDKIRVVAPAVSEKYEYYEIRGASEQELRRQLSRKGCDWKDGRKYDSLTSWYWKWDYGYERTPRSCRVDSFRVTVDINFRYPKWVLTAEASAPLKEKWNGYLRNLVAHEDGHRDRVVNAAGTLCRAVNELPPAATCAELDRAVRSLCLDRMEKLNADQDSYDAATDHGVKQGALFP